MKIKMTSVQNDGCMSMLGIWFLIGGVGAMLMSFSQIYTSITLIVGLFTTILGLCLYSSGKSTKK